MGMYLFRQKSGSLIYALPYITKNEKGMVPVSAKIYFCDKTFGNHVQLLHIILLKILIQVNNNNI
jgi:hypothetical protein